MAGVAIAAALSGVAHAHGIGSDLLPTEPGWQAGAMLSLTLPSANAAWPAPRWPGVPVDGVVPRDQRRGLRLAHGELAHGVRFSSQVGAHLGVGWHDREKGHLESAQVVWTPSVETSIRVGRTPVSLGPVMDAAIDGGRFAQAAAAYRAVLSGRWIEDGLTYSWREEDRDGIRGVGLGLWRGRSFPGGGQSRLAPSLHVQAGWQDWDAHVFAAQFRPQGRGTAAASLAEGAHSHGGLDCSTSLAQRVCFDGTVSVAGASLDWAPVQASWALSAAAMIRRERGNLYSASADAQARTSVGGVWVEGRKVILPGWEASTRLERVSATNRLHGAGTRSLAQDAGMLGYAPVRRVTFALQQQISATLRFVVEAGRESGSTGAVSHAALRLVWSDPAVFGRSW